jgi:hypothetical protein
MKENLSNVGKGGTGQGQGPGSVYAALTELQGLKVTLLTSAADGAKRDLSAIRQEDTIISALKNAAGTITDETANVAIVDIRAKSTITCASVIAGNTVSVAGETFTAVAAGTDVGLNYNQFAVGSGGGADATTAANLAEAIQQWINNTPDPQIAVSVNSNVVTVQSIAEGAGNAPIITGTATRFVIAGSGTGSVTATCDAVVADNTIVINGVTFTAKAEPATPVQFDVEADDTAQAAEIAAVINAYDEENGTLDVIATSDAEVVTFVPRSTRTGNAIAASSVGGTMTVTGSGYFTGGSNSGGVTLTGTTGQLILFWFDKR